MTDEIVLASDSQEQMPEALDDDMQKPIFNKVQVQDVVNREKQKAFERGKKEALMELQQQQQAIQPAEEIPPQAQQSAPQTMGGMQQLSQADIARMIAEQAPQALNQHVQKMQHDHMVGTFSQKMEAAELKYPGLEAELNALNYDDPRLVNFIKLANQLDNTGDIMKEVLDNTAKLETLMNQAYNQPHLAMKALKSLSESIKTNESALAENNQARDPLSPLKPSTGVGMADSQNLSVKDLRKMLSQRR